MCFIEWETHKFILELREIFLWKEKVLRVHGMKSDEKPFFCQIYAIFWENMVHVVIDRYFFLYFWRVSKIFRTEGITDSPFNYDNHINMSCFHPYFPSGTYFSWVLWEKYGLSFRIKISRSSRKSVQASLTLIYPAHFEDVPCQSGVNHIFEG